MPSASKRRKGYAGVMSTSRKLSAGRQFRAKIDAELHRVGEVLGAEIAWSPAEVELLDTVEREVDRRVALERALVDCEDPGGNRALKISTEVRLIESQEARIV